MRAADDSPRVDLAEQDPSSRMRDEVFDIWQHSNPIPETELRPGVPVKATNDAASTDASTKEQTGQSDAVSVRPSEKPQAAIQRDTLGRISTIQWTDGAVRSFEYFGDSKDVRKLTRTVDGVSMVSERTSPNSLQWNVTDFNGRRHQSWAGRVSVHQDTGYYSSQITDSRGNSKDGMWTSILASGEKVSEKMDNDGSRIREEANGVRAFHPDGTETFKDAKGVDHHYNKQHQLDRIRSGDNERTFTYDAQGNVEKVVDKDGTSFGVVFDKSYSHRDVTNAKVLEDGSLSYVKPDGTRIVESKNSRMEYDQNGLAKRLISGNSIRDFSYDTTTGVPTLTTITDRRFTNEGEVRTNTWRRSAYDPEGSFTFTDAQGKQHKRDQVSLAENGELKYKRTESGDKWLTSALNGGDTDIDAARETLLAAITPQIGDQRGRRLNQMMKDFEQRMTDQVELAVAGGADKAQEEKNREQCIMDTYKHMTRLVNNSEGGKPIYDAQTRAKLAENFLYHAADPTTIEQGSTGTCWWESSYAVAFERRAQHMARFVTDIALTGAYVPTAGDAPRQQNRRGYYSGDEGMYGNRRNNYYNQNQYGDRERDRDDGPQRAYRVRDLRNIQILGGGRGSRGGDWSIESAHQDSRRSPICMIIDQIAPAVGGRRGEGRPNAGAHGEARNILHKLTGEAFINHARNDRHIDSREAREFATAGGFTESGGGHMWSYCMRKKDGVWLVVRNDQYQGRDSVVGVVKPENLANFLKGGGLGRGRGGRKYDDYRPDSSDVPRTKWSNNISDLNPDRRDRWNDDDEDRPNRPRRFFRFFR
jgi:YD repeat-containing protein